MSQDHPRRRIEAEQVYHVRIALPEQEPYDQHRKDTFQTVPGQHDQPCLCPQHPQGIGGSRISASVLPDIDSVGFAIKVSRLEQTEPIPHQQTDYPFHKPYCSFSL